MTLEEIFKEIGIEDRVPKHWKNKYKDYYNIPPFDGDDNGDPNHWYRIHKDSEAEYLYNVSHEHYAILAKDKDNEEEHLVIEVIKNKYHKYDKYIRSDLSVTGADDDFYINIIMQRKKLLQNK